MAKWVMMSFGRLPFWKVLNGIYIAIWSQHKFSTETSRWILLFTGRKIAWIPLRWPFNSFKSGLQHVESHKKNTILLSLSLSPSLSLSRSNMAMDTPPFIFSIEHCLTTGRNHHPPEKCMVLLKLKVIHLVLPLGCFWKLMGTNWNQLFPGNN